MPTDLFAYCFVDVECKSKRYLPSHARTPCRKKTVQGSSLTGMPFEIKESQMSCQSSVRPRGQVHEHIGGVLPSWVVADFIFPEHMQCCI